MKHTDHKYSIFFKLMVAALAEKKAERKSWNHYLRNNREFELFAALYIIWIVAMEKVNLIL